MADGDVQTTGTYVTEAGVTEITCSINYQTYKYAGYSNLYYYRKFSWRLSIDSVYKPWIIQYPGANLGDAVATVVYKNLSSTAHSIFIETKGENLDGSTFTNGAEQYEYSWEATRDTYGTTYAAQSIGEGDVSSRTGTIYPPNQFPSAPGGSGWTWTGEQRMIFNINYSASSAGGSGPVAADSEIYVSSGQHLVGVFGAYGNFNGHQTSWVERDILAYRWYASEGDYNIPDTNRIGIATNELQSSISFAVQANADWGTDREAYASMTLNYIEYQGRYKRRVPGNENYYNESTWLRLDYVLGGGVSIYNGTVNWIAIDAGRGITGEEGEAGGWQSRMNTGETTPYWEWYIDPGYGNWIPGEIFQSESWVGSAQRIYLDPIDTWAVDYEPIKVRLTMTDEPDTGDIFFGLLFGGTLKTMHANYSSLVEIDINPQWYIDLGDITRIWSWADGSAGSYQYTINDIEFYIGDIEEPVGWLTEIDTVGGLGALTQLWAGGGFIYAVTGSNGLRSFSVDGSGNLTHIDSDDQGGYYNDVWSDGTFIYVAAGTLGLLTYSADGGGNLTHIDTDVQAAALYTGVWGDGTFIYVTCLDGLRSYSVDGGGNLTYIDHDDQSGADYNKVWGDGNFIYVAGQNDGLRSYSVDGGGILTHIDVDDQGGGYLDVHGDGTFIYTVCDTQGLRSYSVDGGGNLTYIDTDDHGDNHRSVWSDGTLVYSAADGTGIYSHAVDESGNLIFKDAHDGGGNYYGVGGDGTFIYAGCHTSGLRSYSVV